MGGICGNKCRSCKYAKQFGGRINVGTMFCDYVCMEEKLRPCDAGDDCTEYVPKTMKRHRGTKGKAKVL